jgi:hypothetical protein
LPGFDPELGLVFGVPCIKTTSMEYQIILNDGPIQLCSFKFKSASTRAADVCRWRGVERHLKTSFPQMSCPSASCLIGVKELVHNKRNFKRPPHPQTIIHKFLSQNSADRPTQKGLLLFGSLSGTDQIVPKISRFLAFFGNPPSTGLKTACSRSSCARRSASSLRGHALEQAVLTDQRMEDVGLLQFFGNAPLSGIDRVYNFPDFCPFCNPPSTGLKTACSRSSRARRLASSLRGHALEQAVLTDQRMEEVGQPA